MIHSPFRKHDAQHYSAHLLGYTSFNEAIKQSHWEAKLNKHETQRRGKKAL